ncbi:MAG: type II secretion system protein [Verrucomicrobia bacterium]|nr:type II secretion system protein [Verrucomicrobiota bacterium]
MKTVTHSKRITAFTLVELIICIVCIVALLLVILPALVPITPIRANNVACMGNLKQLGLAAREYALDNEERFPWGVPVSEGGTKELAEPFLSDDLTPSISAKEINLNQIPDLTGWYRTNNFSKDLAFSYHFIVCSNELEDFRLLNCPSDLSINKKIINSQDMLKDPNGGRYNISYFINLEIVNDAHTPKAFLFGDRSLFCSRLPVMTNSVNPILFQRGTEPDPESLSDVQWTPELHTDRGNVTFADGSVQKTILNTNLQSYLAQSSNSFNRIVLPFGKRP